MSNEQTPYDLALARLNEDGEMYKSRDLLIDGEYDNENQHYNWVATAEKAEILDWIASLRDDIETQRKRDELLDSFSLTMQ